MGCTDYYMNAVLYNHPDDGNIKMLLRFTGVRNLVI